MDTDSHLNERIKSCIAKIAPSAITGNQALFQTERFGNMRYAILVPSAGKYMAELHFAEIYFQTAGSRVFNVNVENGQFIR